MNIARTLVVVAAAATAVQAQDVLWDQAPRASLPRTYLVDQNITEGPEYALYQVSAVTFDQDVVIESITSYFTNGIEQLWLDIPDPTATLNIFTELSTGNDPSQGVHVDVTLTLDPDDAQLLVMTTSDLDIALGAGTYWIGLTPNVAILDYGQELRCEAETRSGTGAWHRQPGSGALDFWGLGTDEWVPIADDWEGAITILGQQLGCDGDFNADGAVDSRDVLDFLNAFAAGDGAADIDGNGVVDTRDVLEFLTLWSAGC